MRVTTMRLTPNRRTLARIAGRRAERDACAKIADNVLRACITDAEREIATTIRNLILARGLLRRADRGGRMTPAIRS